MLALPVIAALIASGTAFALSRPDSPPTRALSPGVILQPNRYCYNWDFLNNTGDDANGLRIRLAGIQTVTDIYTGTMNTFGAPDAGSGYITATNVYSLYFSGATVSAGDLTQIGLCTDQPALALDPDTGSPPFAWTVDGNPVADQPAFAGLTWHWDGRGHLQVQLTNDPQVSMTLMSLNVLDAGDPLALDDLNAEVAAGLPLVSELAPDPLDLGPGETSTYDVTFDADAVGLAAPSHPYVLEAVLASADDPDNTIHLYSQSLSPLLPLFMPIMMKN